MKLAVSVTQTEFTNLGTIPNIQNYRHAFDIEIPAEALIPENFNSAKAIFALIQQLQV